MKMKKYNKIEGEEEEEIKMKYNNNNYKLMNQKMKQKMDKIVYSKKRSIVKIYINMLKFNFHFSKFSFFILIFLRFEYSLY